MMQILSKYYALISSILVCGSVGSLPLVAQTAAYQVEDNMFNGLRALLRADLPFKFKLCNLCQKS